jgi:hypothetical protein
MLIVMIFGVLITLAGFIISELKLGLTGWQKSAVVCITLIVLFPTWIHVGGGWRKRGSDEPQIKRTWQRALLIAFIAGVILGTVGSLGPIK